MQAFSLQAKILVEGRGIPKRGALQKALSRAVAALPLSHRFRRPAGAEALACWELPNFCFCFTNHIFERAELACLNG